MPEKFYDIVVILFFSVIPLILIVLQCVLSLRRKLVYGFIIPALWSTLGAWMLIAGRGDEVQFGFELFLFFLGGDVILFGILALIKYRKRQKSKY